MRAQLGAALGVAGAELENTLPLKTYVTSGDKNLTGSLAQIGGKGLFTKEIEEALLSGTARFAVHSMKDMPAAMPEGLVTAAVPPREDPRDCFISLKAGSPWDLPEGAEVGAASVRRIAQLLARRPDLQPVTLRGNVGTRLQKLEKGEAAATFLALAGLKRLGLEDRATLIIPTDEMLPAPGQGALCVQARADDQEALALAANIDCPKTRICVAVERAFLGALDGSCRTPIAALATIEDSEVYFRSEVLALDGGKRFFAERRFSYVANDAIRAETIGREAAQEIRERAGQRFFDELAVT